MGGLGEDTRAITDSLDELAHHSRYGQRLCHRGGGIRCTSNHCGFRRGADLERGGDFVLHIGDPNVLIGLFIGGLVPFLIASITMTAVGDAAMDMIEEIRRQFREIPGLMEGTAEPDNAKKSISRPPRH